MAESKKMYLNMGPHHPATHGVLRIELELEGETIVNATPRIGYLHRGIEKIAEHRNYQQVIPLTDRLDYASASANNMGYCVTVEKLMGIEVPKRAQYLRVIMAELARIMGHHLWIGTHALDIGAMSVVFYAFRDREMIMNINEEISGYRLTPTFFRIGGVAHDATPKFIEMVRDFVKWFPKGVDGYHKLLTENKIWTTRTMDIGTISAEDAVNYGFTGPSLRGSGVAYDLRKAFPYSSYDDFDFQIPVGDKGDVYDRYLVRMEEMRQSVRILRQCLDKLPDGPIMAKAPKVLRASEGMVYASVEAPKGEFGVFLVSDGANKPYRLKVRAPGFAHMAAMDEMARGHMLADVVAIIGTMDVVFGEIDR